MGILSLPVSVFTLRKKEKKKLEEKTERQFGKALEMMTGIMVAGSTFENALRETAYSENSETDIIREHFKSIDRMVCLNCSITEAFEIFASKSGSREIECFSSALESMLDAGGNIIALLDNCASLIRNKYETKDELKNCIAEQKLNHRIMTVMPVVLILIMKVMARDYLSYLYVGFGRIMMTAVLGCILISWIMGEKISDIKI